jgi:signal transduction histidine kinase
MELNKTRRWIYILTALLILLILTLGVWWLYLVIKLSGALSTVDAAHAANHLKFMSIVKWEGLTFFVLLASITLALIYFYIQDSKKTKSIQAFFASLTHELKTPLASIRLQGEVIETLSGDNKRLEELTKRLIEDTKRLEGELEKSLQLSRIERDGVLNAQKLELREFLTNFTKEYYPQEFDLVAVGEYYVQADEAALKTIFRNLIENSNRHRSDSHAPIRILLKKTHDGVEVEYNDGGEQFNGDIKKLGQLFYKHESSKGSGIGLYIIKKLTEKMDGEFFIENLNNLIFRMRLPNGN